MDGPESVVMELAIAGNIAKKVKKKEKCGLRKLCCIPIKHKSSKLVRKEETTYRVMASTTKYEFMTCDKRILAAF